MVSPFLPDAEKLAAVRDAIPAVSAAIYLDTATAGPLPAETAAAMAEIADHELRFGRIHRADREEADERRDEARAALAAVVSADVGSIALTRGADEALAVACRGVAWRAGDVLLTITDAGEGLERAAGIAARLGARVVRLPAERSSPDGLRADALVAAVREPAVRLVAIPHVDAVGRVLPLAELAAAVRAVRDDVAVVADGRLAVGAMRVVPAELGVDAYAIAGDSWLLGPESTGGLWLADPVAGRLRPEAVEPDRSGGAAAFEPGSLPVRDAVGLARSAGWLAMYVGLEWVLSRTRELGAALRARLATVSGIEIVGSGAAETGPIVVLRLPAWDADEVAAELGRRIFATVGTAGTTRGPAVRLSVACFNDAGELDRLTDALELIASHTPDSLPRRPPLTILSS